VGDLVRCIRALLAAAALVLLLCIPTGAQAAPQQDPMPALAYYYIWFNPSSWNRAKTDYPLLGRYSSDEQEVMRKHIRLAKEAGLNGFIVSWKSTPDLNRRLGRLIEVARQEDFKLAIIYQGLDFERLPLPAERVAADFDYFIDNYADDPVFRIRQKPLVIWSGSWEFSRGEIADVTSSRRDRLLILGSERDAESYEAKADLFDGDAYYWSSVNPDTYPDYPGKLDGMADVIHDHDGLWIAPAAPGFDARKLGGETVVDRDDGLMLRRQWETASSSNPDLIGLISWNEFSENSHVEPSENYGYRSLEVLADIRGAVFEARDDPDSSDPGSSRNAYGPTVLAALVLMGLAAVAIMRSRRPQATDGGPPTP
jgi:hypothetical protein